MAGTSRVVSLYEQNRLDEARVLCQALLPRVSTACSTFMVFHVYLTAARLHARAGETGAGRRLLRQLRFLLQQGKYGRMLNQLLAEELAFALHDGNTVALSGIALDYHLPAAVEAGHWDAPRPGYHESWVFGGIAAAHFLRGEGRLQEALAVLEVLAQSLQPGEMKARQITVETNRLVILSLLGRNAEALRGVAELYERVHLQCVIRTVLDDAPGFARLLWLAHRERHIRLPDFYLQLYADLFDGFIREQPDIPGPEPLTGKEREVLMLVRRGLSNKDMSREMGVSLSTVKWHLQNIFGKLQVGNRTAALAVLEENMKAPARVAGRRLLCCLGLVASLCRLGGLAAEGQADPSSELLRRAQRQEFPALTLA
jgi:LuxR family maltose regulon positive regulatory protein